MQQAHMQPQNEPLAETKKICLTDLTPVSYTHLTLPTICSV